jgi:integrase/recombinase XerD
LTNRFDSFLAQEIEAYAAYRKSLGYTMRPMLSHLKTFDRYVKKMNPADKVFEPSFFLEFRASLAIEPASINGILSTVHGFFKYLVRKGDYEKNPVRDIPRLPENDVIPFVFSHKEVDQLLSAVCKRIRKMPACYLIDLSRYMSVLLIARCGLRIKEPLRLQRKHYRSKERTIYIEKTKFFKDRLIPVPKSVAQEIKNYQKVRQHLLTVDLNPYLFSGIKQRRLGDTSVRNLFHQAVKDIGLNYPRRTIGHTNFSQPTPHSLRHSFAVNTLLAVKNRGRSPQNALPILSVYMGHESYEHTVRYLKVMDALQRYRLLRFAMARKDEV